MKRYRNSHESLSPRAYQRGLTLIELLACLALAGLLASVLFQVASAVMRSERRLARADQAEGQNSLQAVSWLEATRRSMQADLDQALKITIKPDVIRIEGWCARDAVTAESSHEPVSVVYRIVEGMTEEIADAGAYLLREQSSLGEVQVVSPQRELVAQGLLGWQKLAADVLVLRWVEPVGATTRLDLPAAMTTGDAL